jgi:TolA-binding protein
MAVALLLMWLGRAGPEMAALEARVGDRPFAAGSWLAAEGEAMTLEFSERSRVVFAPQAAARLVRADSEQVALTLERGQLEISVMADASRTWQVLAGPFAVEGTGTIFTVEWQPQARTLTVAVREGEVRVRGGTLPPAGDIIGANRRLVVEDVVVRTAVSVPTEIVAVEPQREVKEQTRRPRTEPVWQRLAAAGEHASALAAVERLGLAAVLEHADAEDLDRLAHSARLAGAGARAREVLQALRRRFPRDTRAQMAAFLLGRVTLEQEHDPGAAAQWFAVYVQEQPSGPLVEEARGRILEIRRSQDDPAAVQAAARAYLEHHPDGRRAMLARGLLDPP